MEVAHLGRELRDLDPVVELILIEWALFQEILRLIEIVRLDESQIAGTLAALVPQETEEADVARGLPDMVVELVVELDRLVTGAGFVTPSLALSRWTVQPTAPPPKRSPTTPA